MVVRDVGKNFTEALAAELKWQLVADGMSLTDLAKKLDIKQANVRNWLKGSTAIPLGFSYAACIVMGAKYGDLVDLVTKRMESNANVLTSGELERHPELILQDSNVWHMGTVFADCFAAELKIQARLTDTPYAALAKSTGHFPNLVSVWLNGSRPVPTAFAFNASQALGTTFRAIAEKAEVRAHDALRGEPATHRASCEQSGAPEDAPKLGPIELLKQALEVKGVDRLAARGEISEEAAEEILAVLNKYVPNK